MQRLISRPNEQLVCFSAVFTILKYRIAASNS